MSGSVMHRLLLLLMLLSPGIANAKDLSTYPCTVFGAEVCFRLPGGTHVDYSVPLDFDFYEVLKDANSIATIYVGNAPHSMDGSVVPRISTSAYGTVRVYRHESGGNEKLDAYITPKVEGASTIHISAKLQTQTRTELMELLSSFRPCKSIKSGGQKCPLNNAWGRELIKGLEP